jgi:sugar-specific transcriptional regulator TrmB
VKKDKTDEVKVKYKKDNSSKQLAKEKEKIEKEIEKHMNELEVLNEKISDENAQLNWVEYRTLAHESKLIEEKIEELMLKLDALDS